MLKIQVKLNSTTPPPRKNMETLEQRFINLATDAKALKFGNFTLKSGITSNYFFNIGEFNTGEQLLNLCKLYAEKITALNIEFDMLFGPAYKGIPLVAGISMILAANYNKNYPYAFNRKETKEHGEGGSIVGHNLAGKVLIIDDVITRGTATMESINIIRNNNAEVAGVIVAVDRKDKMPDNNTEASRYIENKFNIPVYSIVDITSLKNPSLAL